MKKLGILIAVGSSLTLAACNNSSPGSSAKSAAPATTTALIAPGGLNNANGGAGGGFPPPPPSSSSSPETQTQPQNQTTTRRSTMNDDRIFNDSVAASEPVVPPPSPAVDVNRGRRVTDPNAPLPGANLPAKERAAQCSEAYRDDADWTPGLPNPPSTQPIFTDLATSASATRYTDARQDGLFALAVDRANALPAQMQKGNQEFAKQIRDVKISIDMIHTKEVKVRVIYLHHMQKSAVELRGVMERPAAVALTAVPLPGATPGEPSFAGLLTCADADHGCKNILLRVDLKSAKGKIVRSVFVVHRWGDAHITMSEQDRRAFARLPNQNQSAFAEYLSNTVNNSCLNILSDTQAGRRQMPACALQRLQQSCGGEDVKRPSARAFGLRSCAIVYGRSDFELALISNSVYDGVADYDLKRTPFLLVHGPLAYVARPAAGAPVYSHPLVATGSAKGLAGVYLMNNDGGGNLNLRFDFSGTSQDASSRLSVSSLLPNTAYSQSVVQTAQTMPNVPQQDVEQQDLVGDELLAEPQDTN